MLLLQRANELLAENKLKEAEFMFKAVLKEVPDNVLLFLVLVESQCD
ncbi:hypothetical protein [Pseudoalteromonas xiamenensis]